MENPVGAGLGVCLISSITLWATCRSDGAVDGVGVRVGGMNRTPAGRPWPLSRKLGGSAS